MTDLTFILWKWRGWRRDIYTAERVNASCRMLRANISIPIRIICITDDPEGITECETFPLWDDWGNLKKNGCPNCFRRLRVLDKRFAREVLRITGRFVSFDIDSVVFSDITEMFLGPEPFKIVEGKHSRYNGSMWMVEPGTHEHVWFDFHPVDGPEELIRAKEEWKRNGKNLVGSDQAWFSIKIPDAATWPIGRDEAIMSYMLDVHGPEIPETCKIVFFAGAVKPWNFSCQSKCPKLYEEYMKYVEA